MSDNRSDWNSFARANASQLWRQQSAYMGKHVTETIVNEAAVHAGERVLDVACGTGEPAISLATLLRDSGTVVGADISTEPLKIAADRASTRGLTNTEFLQADIHNLPFADAEFDCVTSRFGVMFFADLPRALTEIHRVLKPGGRIALLAWGPMEQPYFQTTIGRLQELVPGAELPASGRAMFKFGDPNVLATAAAAAGFTSINARLQTVPWTWPGTSADVWAYFREVTAPFKALFHAVPESRCEEIDNAVCQAISRYESNEQVEFTATITLLSARK
jgi:ubiquinone/menaquinone biosynthesis C-methylase UbiE